MKLYTAELERAWKVPYQAFWRYFNTHPSLRFISTCTITQKWILQHQKGYMLIRQRIRKVTKADPHSPENDSNTYTHDTKYEAPKTAKVATRIELNAPLTEQEYNLLSNTVFGDIPEDTKRRTYFMDTDKRLYSVDIYPGNFDFVIIETEFKNTIDAERYIEPQWLKELMGGKV